MTPLECLRHRKKQELLNRYPNTRAFDHQANFKDTSEGGLEKCIIYFSELKNFVAKRTKVKANRIDNRITYTDVVGFTKTIGTVKYAKSSMQAGFSDMTLSIKGRTVFCEIKIPGDTQKKAQKEFQAEVEAAGSPYWIVKDFNDFFEQYSKFVASI